MQLVVASLQELVARLRALVASLQELVARLEVVVARLQVPVARLEVVVARLRVTVAKLQVVVARLQVVVATLQVPVATLQDLHEHPVFIGVFGGQTEIRTNLLQPTATHARKPDRPARDSRLLQFVDDRPQTIFRSMFKITCVTKHDKVMNPQHPNWDDFLSRLEGPEGCHFRQNKNGAKSWRCYGGHDKRFAIAIMQKMDDVDVQRSIDYFERNGSYCDCEILFNL